LFKYNVGDEVKIAYTNSLYKELNDLYAFVLETNCHNGGLYYKLELIDDPPFIVLNNGKVTNKKNDIIQYALFSCVK